MEDSSVISTVLSIIAVIATVSNILSFILGRKSAMLAEGQSRGITESNFKAIFEHLDEIQTKMDRTADKTEEREQRREKEYRELLIAVAEVTASYKSLHKRVDRVECLVENRKGEV